MIPASPQQAFNEVVAARAIPWRPTDSESAELTWLQLVRENRVPDTHCGMLVALEALLSHPHPDEVLRLYAARVNLEFPACTP